MSTPLRKLRPLGIFANAIFHNENQWGGLRGGKFKFAFFYGYLILIACVLNNRFYSVISKVKANNI